MSGQFLWGRSRVVSLKRFFQSEIGAAVAWVIASLLIAATIFPWLYTAGQQLAEAAETSDLPSILESIGKSCGRAKTGRYFNRALLLCALCTLPFLIVRIRGIRRANGDAKTPLTNSIKTSEKLLQLLVAFVISGGLLWVMGIILYQSGVYTLDTSPPDASKVISKAVIPTIGASLVEEWFFRGILLGLWLKIARPVSACIGGSLLYAFLHFLQPPVTIGDPGHIFAGFNLLGKTLLHFTKLEFFVTDFATLTVVGLILAWARVKTGRLWFCFGLHAGWVFSFKLFGLLYNQVNEHPLIPWVVTSLRSGIFPLITLVITAVVCHFVLTKFFSQPSARAKAADS